MIRCKYRDEQPVGEMMPHNIATLVNECVDISDDRKASYLIALHTVLDARIVTASDLDDLKSLWANNSDSVYALCELVKRIGSQNDSDNVLLKYVAQFAEINALTVPQIHSLLLMHLLWLPTSILPSQRNALALFHRDPIFFEPIVGVVGQDCLINIMTLPPFSFEKFDQAGIRLDASGIVFFSKSKIEDLNGSARRERPNVNALVVPLTESNMGVNLIQRYYYFSQLLVTKINWLEKSLDECIEAMRNAGALPVQFVGASLVEMKKALLPIHYHSQIDEAAHLKKMESEKRLTHLLASLPAGRHELSSEVHALLLRLNNPVLMPFIVHFARVGFDFSRLNYFGTVLREKLNIDWLSQQCLDFLMQISPRELTSEAIEFFGATPKTDEKYTALALQARFQFILWFGGESIENNNYKLLSVVKQFAEKAANPYLRPAMLKWIRDQGDIFSSSLTIATVVYTFCYSYPNHTALLSVVCETAYQLDLWVWKTLVKQAGSREQRVAMLSLCKTVLLRDGSDLIAEWVAKLNTANEKNFANELIGYLFEYQLLTTQELSDLYFDPRFVSQFNCINSYFESQKNVFLSSLSRFSSNEDRQQTSRGITAVDCQLSERKMISHLQSQLDAYRNANLISVEEAGVRTYQPKGALFGVALFSRESTKNAAKAYNQLNNKMQMGAFEIIKLIRHEQFKKEAGMFWDICCRDFDSAFSLYEKQLHLFVQQPDNLVDYFFKAGRLNEYEFNGILARCGSAVKGVIEEFIVFVRSGYGINSVVFDALLQCNTTPQYFQIIFPASMPSQAGYPKPANAQLPNINPIDQCKMTAEQLYQYEECEMLSGELALRAEFQDRIINVPKNARRTALDLSQPVYFHQIAPSDELGLRDPFFHHMDQRRFNVTQEKLRIVLAHYNGAMHQKPILFFGVINTGNHYVPYVVTKSINGRVFVFTADPSAQSTLAGTVEFKKGQGVCPVGDKESLKRTMRRFFTHTFPGCVYEDIYVTQMLRERDCGPISLFVLREILQNNLITVNENEVIFKRDRLTIQTAPCYSSDIEYYYPRDFEWLSRRARAYWHAVFTSDTPFNYQEVLKSDCFEVDMQIPNEDTYCERAISQFRRDQHQQHQSELCLFLNHSTVAFEALKQKLYRQGQLPTADDIRAFIVALNDEINRSTQSDITPRWLTLYDTYFQNGDLRSNTLIEDVRNIVIYNLKESIHKAINDNFKRYLSVNSHLIAHDKVSFLVADFKQKESALFSCFDVEDADGLEKILSEFAIEEVVEAYLSRLVCVFDDETIFSMATTDGGPLDIQHYRNVLNNNHTVNPLLTYLNQVSRGDELLHLITVKVEEAACRFVDVAYAAIKKRFDMLLVYPVHYAKLREWSVNDLVYWLLPDNASGIIVGKNIKSTALFNLVFPMLLERMQIKLPSWVCELSVKKMVAAMAQTSFYQLRNYNPENEDSFLPILNLLDEPLKNVLFQGAQPNLLGRRLIDFLRESPQCLSSLLSVIRHNQLIRSKINAIQQIIRCSCELLQNGGYKGRRDQVVAKLDAAMSRIKNIDTAWRLLNKDQHSVIDIMHARLEKLKQSLLKNIDFISAELIELLRPGNCDPVSTTQVIRAALCQLLNIDVTLQTPILTEMTAKQIDDEIIRTHALFSSKTLAQLVTAETRLIVATPNQSQDLPKLSDCPNGLAELIARSIGWWRVHHHNISVVMHPTLFRQRVTAPGGLSTELLALIDLVNFNININSRLRDYIESNAFLINAEKLTNTGKVIKNVRDEFLTTSSALSNTLYE